MRTKLYLLLWICFSALFVSCVDDELDVIAVTGVELNVGELSLEVGQSETLVATIAPDNATNKRVAWKSSDESVVTVDINGKVTALKSGRATITVLTENGAKSASCEVTVWSGTPPEGSRTVLVYIAADNSLSSFALDDFAEMQAGMAKVTDANVHLLVYIDDGSSPRLLELKNEKGTVKESVVETYGSRNSVGVVETREVFAAVFSNSRYKADSYGLVYWSHGEGWLPYPLTAGTRWVGQDQANKMNISEFAEILETAPHFDFILFDACFMQSVEVAYELRDYTDYCIGSPTEIPGPGAVYDALVPAMFSAENVAVNVAKAYYEPYEAKYKGGEGLSNENWTAGTSVCALKTDQLDNLASVTRRILPVTADNALLRRSVFNYDKRSGNVGYYDFAGMMQVIADNSDYVIWKQAFDAAVAYWATTPMNYGGRVMFSMEGTDGVSCYIPSTSDSTTDKAYRSTEWYAAAGLNKLNW